MTGYFRYMTWLYNKIKTGIQRGIAIDIVSQKRFKRPPYVRK